MIFGMYSPGFDKEGSEEDVISYFKGEGLDYPILADNYGKVFADYAISGLPTTVMIDRKGNEVLRNTGVMKESEMENMIERVLD